MIKKLLLPFTMLILSSCQVLMLPVAVPLMALSAYHYEKDVSKDPKNDYLVGKKYILGKDTFLYKYYGDNKLYLNRSVLNFFVIRDGEKGNVLDDKQTISFSEIVPLGTCITISKVTTKCCLGGGDLGVQYIYGTLEHSGNSSQPTLQVYSMTYLIFFRKIGIFVQR